MRHGEKAAVRSLETDRLDMKQHNVCRCTVRDLVAQHIGNLIAERAAQALRQGLAS
jgi:hypothetical protein